MEVPLVGVLADNARFLQKKIRNVSTVRFTTSAELDFKIFSLKITALWLIFARWWLGFYDIYDLHWLCHSTYESTAVVISDCFGISKCFK